MNLRKYIYFFIFFVYFMTRQMDLYSQKNSYLKILDNYSTINYQFDKYQSQTLVVGQVIPNPVQEDKHLVFGAEYGK